MAIMCILLTLCRTPIVTWRESSYYSKIIFFQKVRRQRKSMIINTKPRVNLNSKFHKKIFRTIQIAKTSKINRNLIKYSSNPNIYFSEDRMTSNRC